MTYSMSIIEHIPWSTIPEYDYLKCKFMGSARRAAKIKVRAKREKRVKEEKQKQKRRGTQREVRRMRKECGEREKEK